MSMRTIRVDGLASTPATKTKPAKLGILPVSKATIWRWVREGKFPAPYKLGDAVTVWDLEEVEAYLAQRAGGAAK